MLTLTSFLLKVLLYEADQFRIFSFFFILARQVCLRLHTFTTSLARLAGPVRAEASDGALRKVASYCPSIYLGGYDQIT